MAAGKTSASSEKRFGLYPEKLAADRAYESAEMLGWLVHERGIEPHIPVFDKSARSDGTFEREDFTYDCERDVYFLVLGQSQPAEPVAHVHRNASKKKID